MQTVSILTYTLISFNHVASVVHRFKGRRPMHVEIGNVPEQGLETGGPSMSGGDGLEHAQPSTAGSTRCSQTHPIEQWHNRLNSCEPQYRLQFEFLKEHCLLVSSLLGV